MQVDVVLLPSLLTADQRTGRSVVVFDVLRATTTIAAALAAHVQAIEIHGTVESARRAAAGCRDHKLLCGEIKCLPPEGFDLGNSPRQFLQRHAGAYMFLSTTNGTKALVAARDSGRLLAGALVNAAAVARHLALIDRPVTLLCAGTEDAPAMCDLLGAGAVIDALRKLGTVEMSGDASRIAVRLFTHCQGDLLSALRESQGGLNLRRVGLDADIEYAARLNHLDLLGEIIGDPMRVIRAA